MDYKELLEKYNLLSKENDRLKEQLGITNHKPPEMRLVEPTTKKSTPIDGRPDRTSFPDVNNTSDSTSKVKLFISLFKSRMDVYAKRWENKKRQHRDIHPFA
jgi:hypothetical protein